MPLSLNHSRERGELRCRENRSGYVDQRIDVHVILEALAVYSCSLDTLKAELKG
jgi:hypothetical protein